MRIRTLTALVLGLCLLALVVAEGCSRGPAEEPRVKIKGKLTNNGQPIPLNPGLAQQDAGKITLTFARLEGPNAGTTAGGARAGVDGTFEAALPRGKYAVGISCAYLGDAEKKLLSKFSDTRKTPLKCEITQEGQELNIELSKVGTGP